MRSSCFGRHGESCMVHLHDDWKELLRLLTDARVKFLLVGAHALAAHGRPRLTGDMDVFYEPTKANARRLKQALTQFGFPTTGLTIEGSPILTRS